MNTHRIAILGCGTVGSQLIQLMTERRQQLSNRLGQELSLSAVVVRDTNKPRDIPAGTPLVASEDILKVCSSADSDTVIELIGGVEQAKECILASLTNGKNVVTANKAVLAHHGQELFECAKANGKKLFYEAAIAGAIPIVESLLHGIPPGPVDKLTGILNGTCNYILSKLEAGCDFDTAIVQAQEAGFAEADPSLDIEGTDTAHKLALLAQMLTGQAVDIDKLQCCGVEGLNAADVQFGLKRNWKLKLLALFRRGPDSIGLAVAPHFISQNSILANVKNEFNAIVVNGHPFGELAFFGQGAGGSATASSVLSDLLRACSSSENLDTKLESSLNPTELPWGDALENPRQHYVRLEVLDKAGILGRVATLFGEHGISLAEVHQSPGYYSKDQAEKQTNIHIVTHRLSKSVLQKALAELLHEKVILRSPQPIRITSSAEVSNDWPN